MVNEIMINDIAKVKNGTFTRIRYVTDVPVNALAKKSGVSIKKWVESTVRIGINYANLTSVKNRPKTDKNQVKVRVNNFVTYLGNKISYNTNTNDYYLNVFTTPNANTKVTYIETRIVDGKTIHTTLPGNKELLNPWVTSSYLKKSDSPMDMYRVKLCNLIKVGK